jgi:hypothetical protein
MGGYKGTVFWPDQILNLILIRAFYKCLNFIIILSYLYLQIVYQK